MRLLASTAMATTVVASIGFVHAQPVTDVISPTTTAATTQQRTRVPDCYRMALGDSAVITLHDGYIGLPARTLFGLNAQPIQSLLTQMSVSNTPGIQAVVNGFLIDTDDERILVGTGSGTCSGPTMGGPADNVHTSSYQPGQIDAVLLTYLHPDYTYDLLIS